MACAEPNVVDMSEGAARTEREGGAQTQAAEKVTNAEKSFKPHPVDQDERPEGESPDVACDLFQIRVDHAEAGLLTPDFPESLYELLCTLQEGRRLNDQRCSFTLEGGGATTTRRRCHSEPNAAKPTHRGGTHRGRH